MPSQATHKRMARVFLARAYETSSRDRKIKYLRLAVSNSVRAHSAEATTAPTKRRTVTGRDGPVPRLTFPTSSI